MPGTHEISLRFDGIGKLLNEGGLVVPKYQRPYSWEVEQVDDLLSDVANAIAQQANEYFLGTVVLTSANEGRPEVIDGQQRLATTMILLASIRNHLLAANDNERALDIERDYIASRDLRTQQRVARLTLGVTDHPYFDAAILARPPLAEVPTSRESHERLNRAVKRIDRHVQAVVAANGANAVARLIDWVEYIHEKARIIVLRVPDATDAYRVFETLNDRGLELSTADLVKNFILSLAGDRVDEAHGQWLAMAATLEPLAEDDVTISYLRHYWSARHGLTRSKQLFDEIKRRTNSRQAALDLADTLSRTAVKYAALVEASPERWNEYGATTQGHIATLNLLRMTQLRPLLLAVVEKFTITEARRALKLIMNAAVRIVIVGSRSGALEESYSTVAAKIFGGSVTTARQLANELDGLIPQDREFQDAFAIATVSRDALGRYYLRALEKARAGETHPEWVPNANQEEVTLEHVLPENPGLGWGHFDAELGKTMWKRIGNMVLLSAPANNQIGNRPFAEKRPALIASTFELTSQVAQPERWTATAIENRQRELAQLAVAAWPRVV